MSRTPLRRRRGTGCRRSPAPTHVLGGGRCPRSGLQSLRARASTAPPRARCTDPVDDYPRLGAYERAPTRLIRAPLDVPAEHGHVPREHRSRQRYSSGFPIRPSPSGYAVPAPSRARSPRHLRLTRRNHPRGRKKPVRGAHRPRGDGRAGYRWHMSSSAACAQTNRRNAPGRVHRTRLAGVTVEGWYPRP